MGVLCVVRLPPTCNQNYHETNRTDQNDKRRIPQVQKQQAVEGQEADRHPDIVHENTHMHARMNAHTQTNTIICFKEGLVTM